MLTNVGGGIIYTKDGDIYMKFDTVILRVNGDHPIVMTYSPDEVDKAAEDAGLGKMINGCIWFTKYPWNFLGQLGYELKAISPDNLYFFQRVIEK